MNAEKSEGKMKLGLRITNRIGENPKHETIAEKVARWRLTASHQKAVFKDHQKRNSEEADFLAASAEAYEVCAKELEEADTSYLLCPVSELKGQYGVVLFFKDEADSRELIDMVKLAKPNMIERPL
jgi:hypothetical protein